MARWEATVANSWLIFALLQVDITSHPLSWCCHCLVIIFVLSFSLISLHYCTSTSRLTPSCCCHCLVIIICLVIVIDLCTSLTPLLLSSSCNCYSMSLSLHVFNLNFDLCTSASRHDLSPPLLLLSLFCNYLRLVIVVVVVSVFFALQQVDITSHPFSCRYRCLVL